MRDSVPAAPSPLRKNAAFIRLWAAQTISVFGSQFTLLALPIVAVLTLNASPGQMGILAACETAPFLLLGLVAGVWVDRVPRRPVLIAGDLGTHHLQGRMNATMRFLVWGTMPLGGLAGGALGQSLGLWPTIAVAVAGGLLAFLWVLLSPVRALGRIPPAPA